MRYYSPFIAAATLLSSFCASAPTGTSEPISFLNATSLPNISPIPESHQRAAAAGIDIYGEIPGDYIHKNGSIYHFAEGSNAATWARAQLDIKHDSSPPDVRRRWVSKSASSTFFFLIFIFRTDRYWISTDTTQGIRQYWYRHVD